MKQFFKEMGFVLLVILGVGVVGTIGLFWLFTQCPKPFGG